MVHFNHISRYRNPSTKLQQLGGYESGISNLISRSRLPCNEAAKIRQQNMEHFQPDLSLSLYYFAGTEP